MKMNRKLVRLGNRKEYHLVKSYNAAGYDIVQRSAGSNSPIDIWAIDLKKRIIKLIQSKRTIDQPMNYIDDKLKKKIEEENKEFNGMFKVEFEVK